MMTMCRRSLLAFPVATFVCILLPAATAAQDVDVAIDKTGVKIDPNIVWTITVSNNGPDDATFVVVTDPLHICTSYVSDDCGGSNVPPWTWNVGSLVNGAAALCNVVVDPSGCGAIAVSNTLSVSSEESDTDPSNNVDTAMVENAPPVPTLGTLGLAGLLALLLASASLVLRRQRSAA